MPLTTFPPVQWPLAAGNPASDEYYKWFAAVDKAIRTPTLGPLINAVDDVAAAAAGVPINGLYRNGSQVNIRVT